MACSLCGAKPLIMETNGNSSSTRHIFPASLGSSSEVAQESQFNETSLAIKDSKFVNTYMLIDNNMLQTLVSLD